MCVGIPMRVTAVNGLQATATDDRGSHQIDMSLTGPQPPGTWVLTFLGAAREVLQPDEAAKITEALDALRAIMRGQEPGDAFADIEERGPRLPPHLAAAHAAGKTIA